jgi:hypothetical protein
MGKDNVLEFTINPEQYDKLVNEKLDKIRDILAPPELGADCEAMAEDPDSVSDARVQRIVIDLYAAQEALFAAGPRNIRVLAQAELIDDDKAKALWVMAKLLQTKMGEALEEKMREMNDAAEKELSKPDLHVVH